MKENLFLDIGYFQRKKRGQNICGDAFKLQRVPEENRIVAVLSDGLGSGVKANILSSMTATMAVKFIAGNREIIRSAEVIMGALPECKVRKISYATFTIVDTTLDGATRIIEMGNPPFILARGGRGVDMPPARTIQSPKWKDRALSIYEFKAAPQDRIIFFSDGISQSGLGTQRFKLGWKNDGCRGFVESELDRDDGISSHELAVDIVKRAISNEPGCTPHDDMSCAVMYFREPKKMLLFTGPPFAADRDEECAKTVDSFAGQKVICGGTSAEIVSRVLGRELKMDLRGIHDELPPSSKMDGVDLVTEGIFTLTRTAQYLEQEVLAGKNDPAAMLVDMLLENDIIEFLVGTRINEAHQDPRLPMDLELRRNIVKRIADSLKNKYLKEVNIRYV